MGGVKHIFSKFQRKVKHFSTLAFLSLLVSVLTFFHLFLLAKYIGAEEYGNLSTILVYGTLVLQFVLFGTSESGVYLLSNGWSKHQLVTFRIYNMIMFILFLAITAIFLSSYLPIYILLCSFSGFGLAILFEYERKAIIFSRLFLFQRVMCLIFIWGVLFFSEVRSYEAVVLVTFFVDLISFLFQCMILRAKVKLLSVKEVFTLYKSGFNIISFSMSKYIFGGGSKLVIYHTFSAAVAGSYSLAWQLVTLVSILFTQVVRVWRIEITTKVTEKNFRGALNSCYQMMIFINLICLVVGICVYFGLDLILPYYNSDFPDVRRLILSLILYLPVVGFDYSVSVLAIALNKTKLMNFVYFFIAIFTVLIYWFLYYLDISGLLYIQPVYFVFSIVLCHLIALFTIYFYIIRSVNSESLVC